MSEIRNLYKIGDITKKLKITPRTIRYYDQLGLLPNVKRSDGDTRIFDNEDIELIKKTRHYQKTNFLPLFEIKSKLFPSNLSKFKLYFFSDSESKKKFILPESITTIQSNLSSNTLLEKEFPTLSKEQSQKALFIFFYDPENPLLLSQLKQLKNVNIKLYPLIKNGFSSQLLINQVMSQLNTINTVEELDLLISQFIDLSFSIGVLDTVNNFFPEQLDNNDVIENFSLFHPIFISSKHQFEIKHFNKNDNQLSTLLVDEFEEELLKRKRYLTKLEIFSFNNEILSKLIKKKLEDKFDKLTIKINIVSKWPFKGTKGIALTLI